MNKRGISPLIATVLLVSFVVVLSGIIMFWGRQYVTELMEKRGEVATTKLECEQVEVNVISASTVDITIRNTGLVKVSGFIFKFGAESFKHYEGIEPAEQETITFTKEAGVDLVTVVPVLRPGGVGAPPIPCSSKIKRVRLIGG